MVHLTIDGILKLRKCTRTWRGRDLSSPRRLGGNCPGQSIFSRALGNERAFSAVRMEKGYYRRKTQHVQRHGGLEQCPWKEETHSLGLLGWEMLGAVTEDEAGWKGPPMFL